jgi:drug/metabolite transporter (DMT)-like permease
VSAWLTPSLIALLLWGIGQGLVKKNISDLSAARFCLYFVFAKLILNTTYFALFSESPLFAAEARAFSAYCLLAAMLGGTGWILYFQAIVHGPIAIVGTLSAAYPALIVVFASIFLGEVLVPLQYAGVVVIIGGCLGLSYAPTPAGSAQDSRLWIPLSFGTVLLWGSAGTILKAGYERPGADEANALVFSALGAALTLGLYGVLRGLRGARGRGEWRRSFLPMGMLVGGEIAFIVATRYGPVSLTAPISGAYPLVTVIFARLVLDERIGWLQGVCIAAILGGIVLAPG